MYRTAVITLSDRCFAKEREDLSGKKIIEMLPENSYELVCYKLLPDDKEKLKEELIRLSDKEMVNLILTTGGTGLSARDNTPEATLEVSEKLVPGISEALRAYSMQITKRAMLSRGVSVIRRNTLIINLPGSVKAVTESMEFLIGNIEHGLDILLANVTDCGDIK